VLEVRAVDGEGRLRVDLGEHEPDGPVRDVADGHRDGSEREGDGTHRRQGRAAIVRTVVGGEALLAPAVLRRLVDRYAPATSGPDASLLSALTAREVEVLRLIGRGSSNAELARALWISEPTVKTHITRIFRKLDLRDRAQAVVLAYETGLVKPGEPA
jgi:DNA-binding CsgD family transcriptional regulator